MIQINLKVHSTQSIHITLHNMSFSNLFNLYFSPRVNNFFLSMYSKTKHTTRDNRASQNCTQMTTRTGPRCQLTDNKNTHRQTNTSPNNQKSRHKRKKTKQHKNQQTKTKQQKKEKNWETMDRLY